MTHSRNRNSSREIPSWTIMVVSNSLLSIGALLVVSALIYLLFNLEKSDSLVIDLLPFLLAGILLLIISQLIVPGRLKMSRKNKTNHKFKNQ
jgi:ABC-type transport system involved in cytochrome c biogenesis permease component